MNNKTIEERANELYPYEDFVPSGNVDLYNRIMDEKRAAFISGATEAKKAIRNFDVLLKAAVDKAFRESGLHNRAIRGHSVKTYREIEQKFFDMIGSDVVDRLLEGFDISIAPMKKELV